jgi:Right handed beta helix region
MKSNPQFTGLHYFFRHDLVTDPARKGAALTLFIAAALFFNAAVTAQAQNNGMQSELWVAVRTDGQTGTGTPEDPLNANPAVATLRSLVQARGQNVHFHLSVGTFATGPFEMKAGQTLEGAGLASTVIQLSPQSSNWSLHGTNAGCIVDTATYTVIDRVAVKNITFDCNLQNQPSGSTVGAVSIDSGSDVAIENCRAINWGSETSSTECFIFILGVSNNPPANPKRNRIVNCVVDTPAPVSQPGGTTAFDIAGSLTSGNTLDKGWQISSEIRGCKVSNIATGAGSGQPAYFHGFTFGWTYGGMITGNQVYNIGDTAVYADTGPQIQTVISNNVFTDVHTGIFFNFGSVAVVLQDFLISDNQIRVEGDGIALWATQSPNPFQDFRIEGNTIICEASSATPISITKVSGLAIENNTLEPISGNPIQDNGGSTGVTQKNNHETDGSLVTTQIPPTPDRVNITTVASGSYTTLATDHTVAYTGPLTLSNTVTLVNPPGDGFEQIIKDESGTASTHNILVQPTSGTIDGAASKAITANYGTLRVYAAGGNWYTY